MNQNWLKKLLASQNLLDNDKSILIGNYIIDFYIDFEFYKNSNVVLINVTFPYLPEEEIIVSFDYNFSGKYTLSEFFIFPNNGKYPFHPEKYNLDDYGNIYFKIFKRTEFDNLFESNSLLELCNRFNRLYTNLIFQ